jgi:galactose oxidase-like protein
MRKNLSLVCMLVFIGVSCSPSTPIVTPTVQPTLAPTAIVENPPPCPEAELVFHTKLQQMLLVNCVEDASKENPSVIWGWNGTGWQRVTEGGPLRRILGGVSYDEKRNVLVLYGGRPIALGKCNQETWEWDGESWTQKEVTPPTACDHVKMVYDVASGESVLFSGLDPAEKLVNETWSWNGAEWKQLSKEGPESRGHFGFVYDPSHEQILLYGGYARTVTDEFWVWKDGKWKEINFSGPGNLSHFGMTYDTDANALYIFGGATSTSTFSSLTNKTWVLQDGKWKELNPVSAPSERGGPAMAYDPLRKRIVLYGGFDASRKNLGDTWEWDGQGWICLINCK